MKHTEEAVNVARDVEQRVVKAIEALYPNERPEWLQSIGIGAEDRGLVVMVLVLEGYPKPTLPAEIEGVPVVVKWTHLARPL